MLSKILVGTDLSEPSVAVLDYVPKLADVGLEKVILAHIVYVAGAAGMEQALIDQAELDLAGQAQTLREAGFEVETLVEMGVPASKLAHLAEEHEVSAIVVGSHGRTMLQRVLLGSVAMSLLHQAILPVLLVRMELCETAAGISCEIQADKPLAHILFPTDFSEAADAAFEWLTYFAAEAGSRVTLLHAQNTKAFDHEVENLEQLNQADRERLEGLANDLHTAGVDQVETVVEAGAPAAVIREAADERGVSMIVMSTHGRGALQELVVGSVALKVARTSPVPVLMIPHR